MIINHNLSAMNAQRMFKIDSQNMDKSMEKLSSGMRINKGADDAAGLAVSEKMRSQIRGLNQASKNAQDGISFIQTAEGYLAETTDVLQRMRELTIQAANGIYTHEDRMQISVEISQLMSEVDRIASVAQFNTLNMLTGRFAVKQDNTGGVIFHIGANVDQRIAANLNDMSQKGIGIVDQARVPLIVVSNQDSANKSIVVVDKALEIVSKQRADLGAYQNRLEHAIKGVDVASQNLQSAESQIRDTDMARQMVDFVKDQVLTQSASAMLGQANQRSQMVLRLLG